MKHAMTPTQPELQAVCSHLQQPEHLSTLLWEMCYNFNEFAVPRSLEVDQLKSSPLSFASNPNPGLRDIMLAKINTLGHVDKYPHPYEWQPLLQTLNNNEELLWIITKQKGEQKFNTYVGLKFNEHDIGSIEKLTQRRQHFQIFCDNFSRRRFPGSQINRVPEGHSTQTLLSSFFENKSTNPLLVVGMPSLKGHDPDKVLADRDEEKRTYSSLNDIVEPFINLDTSFTLVFTVTPCTQTDLEAAFNSKFTLRNLLKPFLEQEFNHSEGTSTGTGINITPETISKSSNYNEKRAIHANLWQSIRGSHDKKISNVVEELQENVAQTQRTNFGKKEKRDTRESSKNFSVSITPEQTSHSSHEDHSINNSQTIHVTHADLVFLDKILEESLKHLQHAIGGNGFHTCTTIYADKASVAQELAKAVRSTLSGSQNYLRPLQIIPLANARFNQFEHNIALTKILQDSNIKLEVMNSERASFALPVPDSDLPGGMNLKRSIFYSKPEESFQQLQSTSMPRLTNAEHPVTDQSNEILLGKAAYYENALGYHAYDEMRYAIPKNDIFSHMFISGAPGGGKSKRTAYILNHLPQDIRLVVLETAKKEYGDLLARPGKKVRRYTLGNSTIFPLRINPFFFEPGTNLKQHIAAVSDAITDLLPVEALIGPKLRNAIEQCYIRCGWDIESSTSTERPLRYPDMLMFNSEIVKCCESLTDYGAEVRGNYTGALKNRGSIFLDSIYQDIFAFDGNKTIDQIFPPDTDVVIEMEDMPPGDINMPAFIITILMHRLRAYRFLQVQKERELPKHLKTPRFVIAIEEAHNVLSREIENSASDEKQSGKGRSLLTLIKKTLAEGRGIGMGVIVIDQSAHAIAPSVLTNTNMKIIFRQKDGDEIETIGKSIGLSEKDRDDLQFLETGECVISTLDNPKPFKLARLSQQEVDELESIERNNREGGVNVSRIDPWLACPPYARASRYLDDLFAKGLFTPQQITQHVEHFYVTVARQQPDLCRYILGKYLLNQASKNNRLYQVLNEYLDVNTIHYQQRRDAIKRVFLSLMHDPIVDTLLYFIDGKLPPKAFLERSLHEQMAAKEKLFNLLSATSEVTPDKLTEFEHEFNALSIAILTQDEKELSSWRMRFCAGKSYFHFFFTFRELFEHLQYH